MAEETEERKPVVQIGFCMMPVVTANFHTEEDGKNEITENLLGLFDTVLNETVNKLLAAASLYLKTMGVEMTEMSAETLQEVAKQAINQDQLKPFSDREVHTGVITNDGETILDADYHDATSRGERTDN